MTWVPRCQWGPDSRYLAKRTKAKIDYLYDKDINKNWAREKDRRKVLVLHITDLGFEPQHLI